MNPNFIQAKNGAFFLNNEKIMLRGFAVGAWMNLENFMIRIPGNEKRIRQAFTDVYGKANTARFFDDYLNYFLSEADFIFLKSLGINVLRFALNYRHFEDDQAPGVYKEEGFKHLDRALGFCRKYGIFAILDLHTAPGGQNPDQHAGGDTGVAGFWEDAALRERLINLWGYIAKKYQTDPIIVGFDLLNEPCFVSDINAFNDFFERTVRKIRAVDHNHIIFLEGDDWSKDFSLFKRLGGHQQALSFHLYPGQHVSIYENTDQRKTELDKIILKFTELREKTDMPLWVGETGGLFPKDKLGEGIKLIEECLDLFEKYNISWTIWTYKDARAMGVTFPKENTKWMLMGNEFRSKWQSKGGRSDTIAAAIFEMLENKFSYSLDEKTKSKLFFRISALLDELHTDYLVKPKLQSIPWEEMKEYPKSFQLGNCDYWKDLAELVKTYTPIPAEKKHMG